MKSKKMKILFEDKNMYFFWKEQWIATTFGNQKSFLDNFDDPQNQAYEILNNAFWKDWEYWLLNRLDNKTWWLLYFAKSKEIFYNFKNTQKQWLIKKIYICDIQGDFPHESLSIDYPIMHHKHLDEKMVILKSAKDESKWRWKKHMVNTEIKKLYYDVTNNTTTLEATITKWIRHQIRAHLASIWYPIIWDDIYWKYNKNEILHLWSIGLSILTWNTKLQ